MKTPVKLPTYQECKELCLRAEMIKHNPELPVADELHYFLWYHQPGNAADSKLFRENLIELIQSLERDYNDTEAT